MNTYTFGFIGLGLIGGSIARALKKINPSNQIIAYDTNHTMLKEALMLEIVDIASNEISDVFSTCDMIFLCAPVAVNNKNLALLQKYLSSKTLITDVGSVKTPIHDEISALGLQKQFIGGHPMAGSEKSGFSNANYVLLENAYYILTPTPEVSEEKIAMYQSLVTQMGAIPLLLSYEEHDYVTAAISHLPHIIAASLVNLVKASDSKAGTMKLVAAGGFKDITRIASSSPAMWESICLTNSKNITALLDAYIDSLQKISYAMKSKEEGFAYQLFSSSKEYRDSFSNHSGGPIKKIFSCYVDIPDEAGALASIAALLAKENISIKNIGIVHNREFEEGVLQIEFYEQASLDEAALLLQRLQYTVYERK